jgi:hypothetical protein
MDALPYTIGVLKNPVNPIIPSNLYACWWLGLKEVFEIVGQKCGDNEQTIDKIFSLLPKEIQAAPAFLSLLSRQWSYEFGTEYRNYHTQDIIFGGSQCPPVEWLYTGMKAFDSYPKILTPDKTKDFKNKLSTKEKHLGALNEMAPLTVLKKESTLLEYETAGRDGKTIDFSIQTPSGLRMHLEVKCRIKELIENLVPRTEPNPETLFHKTDEKFEIYDPQKILQGLWIHSLIGFSEKRLLEAFNKQDSSRIHFAVLAHWTEQAYVLARTPEIAKVVQDTFHLPLNDSIVIRNS